MSIVFQQPVNCPSKEYPFSEDPRKKSRSPLERKQQEYIGTHTYTPKGDRMISLVAFLGPGPRDDRKRSRISVRNTPVLLLSCNKLRDAFGRLEFQSGRIHVRMS